MASEKKTIVVYSDWAAIFDQLEDHEAGKLIKHFFKYVNDENPELDDRLLKMAFEPIKLQLKRDLSKWEETKKRRAEAGRKGGLKSGETRKIEANEANASFDKQNEANEADNENENVNDNVNDILLKKKQNYNDRKLKFSSTLQPFLEEYGKDMLNEFYLYWTEPNKSGSKFRQELEKTWDLKRRLATWAKNDKSFGKPGESKSNVKAPVTFTTNR